MLSRVADSLYWMGRYLERAENITRLLLVTEDFSTETQGLAEDLAQTAWKDMLEIFPSAQLTREITPFAPLSVPYLSTLFTDQANAYSINFSIRKAREYAPLYCTQWRRLLRGLSSRENSRRVSGARLEPNLVIGFLLFDADSPRSLGSGAGAVRDYLAAISGPAELTAPARIIGRLH